MSDFENPTVEDVMPEDSAQDDAAQDQLGEALSTITDEVETEEQQEAKPEQPHTEPGWIKQRIGKAVDRAVAEAEARIRAEYQQQIQELQEERLERQAQDLVRSGEFKSLDTAKEYLQLKGGRPQQQKPETPAADQQPEIDPVIQARADMLAAQARKIKAARGLDVMAAYNSDPEIQRKLASGEWDFYDVAESMSEEQRRAPTISRSANGARSEKKSIADLSEAEWKRLNQNLANGRKYR